MVFCIPGINVCFVGKQKWNTALEDMKTSKEDYETKLTNELAARDLAAEQDAQEVEKKTNLHMQFMRLQHADLACSTISEQATCKAAPARCAWDDARAECLVMDVEKTEKLTEMDNLLNNEFCNAFNQTECANVERCTLVGSVCEYSPP